MVEPLTEKQIDELRKAFALFDTDEDNYITIKELSEIMRKLGNPPSITELQDMESEVDIDGNGNISFQEYISIMARRMNINEKEDELKEVFNLIVREKELNKIGPSDLKALMIAINIKITDDEIMDMIKEADHDLDGYISYEEFKNILENKENKDYY
jgi:Ca2+-binding EF-hand superfamily protein